MDFVLLRANRQKVCNQIHKTRRISIWEERFFYFQNLNCRHACCLKPIRLSYKCNDIKRKDTFYLFISGNLVSMRYFYVINSLYSTQMKSSQKKTLLPGSSSGSHFAFGFHLFLVSYSQSFVRLTFQQITCQLFYRISFVWGLPYFYFFH